MHLFGNLGHVVLLLPLSLALLGYLVSIGARRDVGALALSLVACLTITLFAKLFFEACGGKVPHLRIESPSGHESFSAAVYGCLAILIATGRPARQRLVIYAGAALLILLIGFARVVTRAHTPEEVALGLLIGVASTVLFRSLRREPRLLPIPWRGIALVASPAFAFAFVALLLAGHWTPEYIIDAIGRRLGAHFGLCV
jgi:membrane-associated phospholipid phosphatase